MVFDVEVDLVADLLAELADELRPRVANGSSSGQMRRMISMPGSWPVDWMTTRRPRGLSARAHGASTVFTFDAAGVRDLHGWAHSTRS